MYMCGDAIIMQVATSWTYAMAVLMSRMCPHGLEATMYALSRFLKLWAVYLRTLGYMLPVVGHNTTPPCSFQNLWFLILIGHMMMPLAVIH